MSARTDVASLLRDGFKALADNRYADAIVLLSAAIGSGRYTRDPGTAAAITAAYRCRADAYERLYQFDKAITDLTEAIRRDPKRSELWAVRGLMYAEIRHFHEALSDSNEALRLDPKNALAYALRGDVARLKFDWNAALSDATKAIGLNRQLWRAYQVRGRAYQGKKEYAQAVREFDRVIGLNPSYAQAYLARADALYESGDYKRASEAYRQTARRFPLSNRPHHALATFLATCPDESMRDGKEALTEATRACELAKWAHWEDLEALAAAYAEIGDFGRAITYMNRVLSMRRPDADAEDEKEIRQRLATFQEHKPYREKPTQ